MNRCLPKGTLKCSYQKGDGIWAGKGTRCLPHTSIWEPKEAAANTPGDVDLAGVHAHTR